MALITTTTIRSCVRSTLTEAAKSRSVWRGSAITSAGCASDRTRNRPAYFQCRAGRTQGDDRAPPSPKNPVGHEQRRQPDIERRDCGKANELQAAAYPHDSERTSPIAAPNRPFTVAAARPILGHRLVPQCDDDAGTASSINAARQPYSAVSSGAHSDSSTFRRSPPACTS